MRKRVGSGGGRPPDPNIPPSSSQIRPEVNFHYQPKEGTEGNEIKATKYINSEDEAFKANEDDIVLETIPLDYFPMHLEGSIISWNCRGA